MNATQQQIKAVAELQIGKGHSYRLGKWVLRIIRAGKRCYIGTVNDRFSWADHKWTPTEAADYFAWWIRTNANKQLA